MLPVVDTIPVLAESTAGVELAGGAEKATAAEPDALGPGRMGGGDFSVGDGGGIVCFQCWGVVREDFRDVWRLVAKEPSLKCLGFGRVV